MLHRFAIFILATLCAVSCANAQDAEQRLTIKLDADSTQADGLNGAISFRGVRITQGDIYIRADEAHSSGLDFRNSTWTFQGNVEFGARGTTVAATRAVLSFEEQELVSAALTGAPVKFNQGGTANVALESTTARLEFATSALDKAYFTGQPVTYVQAGAELTTNARADSVFFDAGQSMVTLQDDAWIGEGAREIRGNRITYNYIERSVVAASNAEGDERVTITIAPPVRSEPPAP
ncbi:MAG: LptA/OstA family protein [Gammaproteobacteria bacterium]